jgi:hypothetical protein
MTGIYTTPTGILMGGRDGMFIFSTEKVKITTRRYDAMKYNDGKMYAGPHNGFEMTPEDAKIVIAGCMHFCCGDFVSWAKSMPGTYTPSTKQFVRKQ